jgi:hypothetical protein
MMSVLILGVSGLGLAQDSEQRWTVYESFQGSTNSAGQVFKLDTSVAYHVNPHFEIGGGLPVYAVRGSSSSTTSTSTEAGIGNAYADVRLRATGVATFVSTITGTAPTGNRDKGFSTGRATVDWNNYFAVPVSRVTPYANVGIANTISDTAFFIRPFTSLGIVGHFEGGATLAVAPVFSVGASAYSIAPTGQQRIVSKIVQRKVSSGSSATGTTSSSPGPGTSPVTGGVSGGERVFETTAEVVGDKDLANDHGFSTWLDLHNSSGVSFGLGYNRSVRYQFDTVFFSLGFNLSSLIRNK